MRRLAAKRIVYAEGDRLKPPPPLVIGATFTVTDSFSKAICVHTASVTAACYGTNLFEWQRQGHSYGYGRSFRLKVDKVVRQSANRGIAICG